MFPFSIFTNSIPFTCSIFRIISSDVDLNSVDDSVGLEVKNDVRPCLEAGREVEYRLGQAEGEAVRQEADVVGGD